MRGSEDDGSRVRRSGPPYGAIDPTTSAHSSDYERLLNEACLAYGYSSEHERPLNGEQAPTQRGTSAHSTGHERLLNEGVGLGQTGKRA
jgi:hypothetical protein